MSAGLRDNDPVAVTPPAIRALLFGVLRERLGAEVVVPAGPATVAAVWEHVAQSAAGAPPHRDGVRCARNLEYCGWDDAVAPGDEVAFLPPVCGGSVDDGAVSVSLDEGPIDAAALLAAAGGDADGAVACFIGRVRDHSDGACVLGLDYESYVPMALAMLRRIAAASRSRHGLSSVAVAHRLGALHIGDVAVVVVTAAPHRGAALDACREVIDEVKADVPIWKREHTLAGARWVDARCAVTGHG